LRLSRDIDIDIGLESWNWHWDWIGIELKIEIDIDIEIGLKLEIKLKLKLRLLRIEIELNWNWDCLELGLDWIEIGIWELRLHRIWQLKWFEIEIGELRLHRIWQLNLNLTVGIEIEIEIEFDSCNLDWVEIGNWVGLKVEIGNAACVYGIARLLNVWAHKMHDYACMNAWNAWLVCNLTEKFHRNRQNTGRLGT